MKKKNNGLWYQLNDEMREVIWDSLQQALDRDDHGIAYERKLERAFDAIQTSEGKQIN